MAQRTIRKLAIFGGLLASAAAIPAYAQSVQASGTQPTRSSGSTELNEIIVTASRRAENLQKQSRDVTALGAEALTRQGVVNADALSSLVPGLQIASAGAQMQVYIRGVGDRTLTSTTDPAVALNIDGVYYPKAFSVTGQFFDLERVEVLRGPQGTLYGRNATSGAINLITAKPQFTLGGFAEAEYGNYNKQRFTGAITGPITDTLAFRLAGQVVDRDGYLSDGYNDEGNQGVRGELLWKPTPKDSLLLTGSYTRDDSKGSAAVVLPGPAGAGDWVGPSDPRALAVIASADPFFATIPSSNGFQKVDTYGVTANYEHEFNGVTLTVLPSYVDSHLRSLTYSAVIVPVFVDTHSVQKSLEVRLADSGQSRLKWIVGGFASHERVKDQYQTDQAVFDLVTFRPKMIDETLAVFGEATYSLTDRLRLTGGARYTWEKKVTDSLTAQVPYAFGPTGPIRTFPVDAAPPGALDTSGRRTDKAVNFRAGVEYDVAPASMLYANVATGFKAGGFYADILDNGYNPEKLTSYQAGLKNRFFDNRLQVNVEGYYWDYKDKQESFLGLAQSGGITYRTANAASARLYGVDVSVMGMITSNDIVSADVEYNNTRYGAFSYTSAQFSPAPPANGCEVGPFVPGVPFGTRQIDCSGKPLVNAPRWSGRVGYQHTQDLGASGEIVFNIDTQFSSSYYFLSDFTSGSRADGYTRTAADVTWKAPGKAFSVTLYVKNIENQAVYTGGSISPVLPALVFPFISAPRTYGARVRYAF
ncbi:TonB-dependent receptor [Caulobacter sp. LARHSG274]